MSKVTVTYSIDEDVIKDFRSIIKDKRYIMSGIVELLIKDWVNENK